MKNFIKEFKEFINRGSVVDLAVGVIIGGAFGKIVSSLVNDILMPFIGVLLGGLDFTTLSVKIGSASIAYGSFIQNILDFVIIALSIFIFIKLINKLLRKSGVAVNEVKDKKLEKKSTEEVDLLKSIDAELKKLNKK